MKRSCLFVGLLALLLVVPEESMAIGRGGGRGGGASRGGGGSRGGISRSSGARSRPSTESRSRPSTSRPHTSAPNLGGSRGSAGHSNFSRPQTRPSINRPSSRPQSSRPGGGLKPSTRPSTPPSNASRPNIGSRPGSTRPSTRPGTTRPSTQPGIASRPGTRPSTSLPNLGVSRPGFNRPGSSRPGSSIDLANRPNIGNRPGTSTRPNLSDRPGISNRPGSGTDRPDFGNRPGPSNRPGGDRPTASDLGDFLGMSKPLRPGGGSPTTLPARPGIADRPGIGNRPPQGNRPGIVDRPGSGNRPGIGNRPGNGNRPNIGDRWNNNNIISNRPGWASIDNSTNINISNRWNNAFTNVNNRGWWNASGNRRSYWNGWADGVRSGWGNYHRHDNWFGRNWWSRHYCPMGGWHYHYWNHGYPSNYWWTVPVWGSLTSWFNWSSYPQTVWSQPAYYDYGSGGNVTYQDNYVYVGGEQVATSDEFAQSAMDLATVPPPESEDEAAQAEWMPLGTFAVSMNEKDTQPSQVVQLAVSKDGIVSGTLYNIDTDQAQAIQGQVDKETQRVAFRIGESEDVVAETGLYNLTQDEAPVLIHFGTERTENYLLVRLEDPESDNADSTAS